MSDRGVSRTHDVDFAEELQSVNEELHTVDSEYHDKVLQLTELDEILGATSSGLVVLDTEMRLARFNLAAKECINLLDADLGRPLAHLTHQLHMDDLLSMVANVISSGSRASRGA
ncbi:MAG: PAS domain-containing protein [Deltaproteobacteria bacterium]|nr:PAS domain-containing protein [Deltaproteobacteria bacterium]